MTDDVWAAWRAARPPTDLVHLDSAAVGRSSTAILEAVAGHARLEAEIGGYVAEEHAESQLTGLRRDVAGLLGTDPDGVAFTESALSALGALLRAWPLRVGARVLVAASEWGPNLELLDDHGLLVEPLPVDGLGVVDLEALGNRLASGAADVVLVDHVAAHRGLVQPAAEVVAVAHEHGVPVWLDAAQAVGHVVVPPGADAVFATSRKFLTGPRGVGMLTVAEGHRSNLRVRRPAKYPDRPEVQLLESSEAHVAGRVGLGTAVQEYLELGPDVVAARLVDVGKTLRQMVEMLPDWEVVLPEAPAGAITALRPTTGQDVGAAYERLLHEHRILTTVCLPWRAPGEMEREPWLRVSPHVDLTDEDLERLAVALTDT
jgi:pyridoxal 5-phosphate dependent beta-lyase